MRTTRPLLLLQSGIKFLDVRNFSNSWQLIYSRSQYSNQHQNKLDGTKAGKAIKPIYIFWIVSGLSL